MGRARSSVLLLSVALLLATSLPSFAGRGGGGRGGGGAGRDSGAGAGSFGRNQGPGGNQRSAGFSQQNVGFSQHNATVYSPNVNVAQPSVSGNRTWNNRQDTDINVNNYHGYRGGGVGTTGAAAVGSVTYSIPVNTCSQMNINGTTYYNCAGTYYLPSYQGSTVSYEVVNPP